MMGLQNSMMGLPSSMMGLPKWSGNGRPAQPGRGSRGARGLALGLLCVVATWGCGREDPSPGAGTAARSGTGSGEPTPKVLLIGIDGVRPDVLAEVPTPNIDALVVEGAFTDQTTTTTPSVSGPSWSSMLTGVWPEKHGVRSNDFVAPRYDDYPDFLTRIEEVRPDLTTAAVVDWLPLVELPERRPLLGPRIDVREALDGYELGWAEAEARSVELAVELLLGSNPDALFVYLGNPDETSHRTGAIGEEYREAVARADADVGRLVEAVKGTPSYSTEAWLVLISTDHGRRSDGGHGGESPEEMTTFIVASGPSVVRGRIAPPTYIVDVAATALAHLEIETDSAWALDGEPVGLR